MSRDFTEEQIENFKKNFDLYDKNRKGYIPTRDIGLFIRSIGFCPSESEISQIIDSFSKTGDEVTFDDLLIFISSLDCVLDKEKLKDCIKCLDIDGNNEISKDLFMHIMQHVYKPMNESQSNDLLRYLGIPDNYDSIDTDLLYEKLSHVSDDLK
ncbi:hypothetical protein WA158_002671 [Blastocystis sp. Blastoise]